MKIKEILLEGIKKLKENNIEDENIKARLLLQYVLKQDKNYLIVNQDELICDKSQKEYEQYIEELIKGKPLQYITHKQEFMGIDFYVDENVLIPQPDTEILVEEAISAIKKMEKSRNLDRVKEGSIQNNQQKVDELQSTIKILDLCTGSGAIAISIASKIKNEIPIEIYASDISKKALQVAKKNALQNNVKINFIQSDMFQTFESKEIEKFDIIVSNPPYIEEKKIEELSNDVKSEPHIALSGGKDGLEFYRIIAKEAPKYINENGRILMEIGYDQREPVMDIFRVNGIYRNITGKKDLSGNDRVIEVTINPSFHIDHFFD